MFCLFLHLYLATDVLASSVFSQSRQRVHKGAQPRIFTGESEDGDLEGEEIQGGLTLEEMEPIMEQYMKDKQSGYAMIRSVMNAQKSTHPDDTCPRVIEETKALVDKFFHDEAPEVTHSCLPQPRVPLSNSFQGRSKCSKSNNVPCFNLERLASWMSQAERRHS